MAARFGFIECPPHTCQRRIDSLGCCIAFLIWRISSLRLELPSPAGVLHSVTTAHNVCRCCCSCANAFVSEEHCIPTRIGSNASSQSNGPRSRPSWAVCFFAPSQQMDQNVYLAPNWNWRGVLEVVVIRPKPLADPLLTVGTFGAENCALLATL